MPRFRFADVASPNRQEEAESKGRRNIKHADQENARERSEHIVKMKRALDLQSVESIAETGGGKSDVAHFERNSKERDDDRNRAEEESEDDVADRTGSVMLCPVSDPVGELWPQALANAQAVRDRRLHTGQGNIVRSPSGGQRREPEKNSSDDGERDRGRE